VSRGTRLAALAAGAALALAGCGDEQALPPAAPSVAASAPGLPPCPSVAAAASAPSGAPAVSPAASPGACAVPAAAGASGSAGPSPAARGGGSGAAVLLGGLAVAVAGAVAVAFVWWQRRQRLAAAYGPAGYTGPAGPPSRDRAGVTPFGGPPRPAPRTRPPGQDEARLTHALRDVAASGISPALTQQVERLLARPGVPRADLVQAAIRHRDQLAGRDERLARALLDALRDAGVTETVVEGVRVDGQRHEVVGSLPAPSPSLHDTIAETTQCGYVDGDRVLRLPKVLVYRAGRT
jgi:hypothetical protein